MGIDAKAGPWMTFGRYDVVGVFEAADDETFAKYTLSIGFTGNIVSETMRAFTGSEFEQIVKSLP